jgi:hypothetical protein
LRLPSAAPPHQYAERNAPVQTERRGASLFGDTQKIRLINFGAHAFNKLSTQPALKPSAASD